MGSWESPCIYRSLIKSDQANLKTNLEEDIQFVTSLESPSDLFRIRFNVWGFQEPLATAAWKLPSSGKLAGFWKPHMA